MDAVLRGAITYLIVWLIFRVAGKRSLAETTTFDFVLLLIISETTQSALTNNDNSFTNTILLVTTLVGIDVALSLWKQRSERVDKLLDGVPLLILADGIPIAERLDKERVGEDDILAAARRYHGLERLEQVKYAVLERNGGITIIPK
jgi:uncharacterized membrane protein YcaP (DUF421 family)